jgi:HlyD family secretion protein
MAIESTKRLRAEGSGQLWLLRAGIAVALVLLVGVILFKPPAVPVAQVRRGNLPDEVEGTGTVTADTLANIAPEITGRVESVAVDQGNLVHKGEIIAMLDQTTWHRRLAAAEARLAATEAEAAESRWEWVRERGLVKRDAVSEQNYHRYTERLQIADAEVLAARAQVGLLRYQLSLTRIPVLFSGIVVRRWVVPGASVVPGETMFTVADTRLIYVRAHIDQDFSGQVRAGEIATVILRGRQNQPLKGTVLRIDPEADAATEETVAEVAFKIPPADFQLGQWANVFIRVATAKNALLIPGQAIIWVGGRSFVFAVDRHNVVHRVAVRVLAQSPRLPLVAVAGALRIHERVALRPTGLKSAERVSPCKPDQCTAGIMGGSGSGGNR